MGDLLQIVVQELTADEKRAIAQYGDNIIPSTQTVIVYSSLTVEEKAIYDAFITMIKTK